MPNPFETGPIAPENNPPINSQYYSPKNVPILSIQPLSYGISQVITTVPNEFVIGQLVRFDIPNGCGMELLNGVQGYVIFISGNELFFIDVDTSSLASFNPTGNPRQVPQVIPIGDTNSGAINASGRINNTIYINGSFINVSPM